MQVRRLDRADRPIVSVVDGGGGASRIPASTEEHTMPEKSPQRPAGKKAGKSLKEKRAAKQAKKHDKHEPLIKG